MEPEEITDEVYFAELKLMFQTKGWQILMLELRDNAIDINDLQDTKSLEDLCYRKGQLAAIGRLLNFQDTLAQSEAEEANEGLVH